jgi:hypothetical protein
VEDASVNDEAADSAVEQEVGMRRTAREMAIGSSGGMSYYPEYYWKSENGAA